MPTPRAAGVLLHPTSLPGPFGIGDLGPAAFDFLAWAESASLSLWQVLPLGPTGHGDAPYNALSAFAGNPLLISPRRLVEDGLLFEEELSGAPEGAGGRVDHQAVGAWKEPLLRLACERIGRGADADLGRRRDAWADAPEQSAWLDDWALYAALKERHGGASWLDWSEALRRREPAAQGEARRELAAAVEHHRSVQFLFFRQWAAVRREAARRGVEILGDVPFYVSLDSADVWARQELFELDASGRPLAVSGVPPDYFSETGQLWGNPVYRWDRMREGGFRWWIERIAANLRLVDRVRLDHFRGFVAFWRVPAGLETAEEGEWVEGPGEELFAAVERELGELPLVAEDLGVITPEVEELVRSLDLPGMRVLQFGFGAADSDHAPHRHQRRGVVFTGTHDNDTSRGWFDSLGEEERARVLDYLGTSPERVVDDMVRTAMTSVAELAVVPAQDLLGLGSEARMNTPGQAWGNWSWRLRGGELGAEMARRVARLVEISGRERGVGEGSAEPGP